MLNKYFKRNDIFFNDLTRNYNNNMSFQNNSNNINQCPNSTNCCFNGCCHINHPNQQCTRECINNQCENSLVGPQGEVGPAGPQGEPVSAHLIIIQLQ